MSREMNANSWWSWGVSSLALVAILSLLLTAPEPLKPDPVAGTQPESSTLIPQFGHGGGFSSTIILLNLSTTTSTLSVFTHDRTNGSSVPLLRSPGGTPFSSLSTQLDPGGTMEIHSASPSSDPDQPVTGWAFISSLNTLVRVQTTFSIDINGLQARAQIPGRNLRQSGSFFVPQEGRTGVAIVNPPFGQTADVQLGRVGSDGRVIDIESLLLDPGTGISEFIDEIFPPGTTPQGGVTVTSVEFRSNTPVAVLPLQQQGFVLTTQDVFPPRPVETLFRQ